MRARHLDRPMQALILNNFISRYKNRGIFDEKLFRITACARRRVTKEGFDFSVATVAKISVALGMARAVPVPWSHIQNTGEELVLLLPARALLRGVHCPARTPPFLDVKHPARAYESTTQNRFTVGNAQAT